MRVWFNPQLFNAECLAFAGFSWLFSLAVWYSSRKPALDQVSKAMAGWSLLIPLSALLFTLRVLASYYYSLIDDTAILFLFILAVDLSILLIAWARVEQRIACLYATGAIFILLAVWTSRFLTTPLLYWALAACCVFALLHGVLPHLMQKLRPALNPPWWVHLAVPAAFCLIAVPLLNFHESSPLIWLGIGVLSILGISLAMLTFSVVALVSTVLLTALITVSWLLSVPASLLGISEGLLVIGSFALIFFFAGLRMVRKVSAEDAPVSVSIYDSADMVSSPEFRTQIPAVLPAILPFLLLITLLMRLKPDNPTSVFALAGLMSLLLLGLVRWSRIDWAGVMGLTGVFFLQLAWHALPVSRHSPLISLAWIGAFYLLFSIFPFMFSASIGTRLVPWFTAVLAGLLHFILAYILIKDSFPNQFMGLLPALFGVFSMLALWKVLGILRELEAERQNSILALFGGLVIFFITLIFPIQFSRQWLTISWAMEGAALIWLFRRIPHSGLSRAGVCLLLLSFVRLAFNPAVFSYSERSPVPVFNWYLYTYGIVAICQFIGMYLHAGSAEAVRSKYTASVLGGIGTILLFLLLNLEIADYFSGGSSAMFKFSASFAQDMTYSLGWAAFAFILLSVGMWAGQRGARLAAIGLLSVTLLKLFMHDLWRLGGLYRIAAFVGLALVLIPVSFLYQRFMPTGVKPRAMKDEK